MQAKSWLSPGPGVRVLSVDRVGGRWVVAAVGRGSGVCPGCGEEFNAQAQLASKATSGPSNPRRERDGAAAVEPLAMPHHRMPAQDICGADALKYFRLWGAERVVLCRTRSFYLAIAPAGKPGERLMGRLGAPVSHDTNRRHWMRRVADRNATTPVRVAGIDDWSWRKGEDIRRNRGGS